MIFRLLRPALLAALLPLVPAAAQAQATFPDRTITLTVPFAPGGGTDLIARAVGKGLADDFGVSVVILNKPGSGTIIGTEAVARSAPDGYNLLVATIAHSVNPSLHKKLSYDTKTAFAPIALIASSHNVLVVKTDSPLKSVQDIVAKAKAKPNSLSYASQGPGTSAHLAGELFQNIAKVQMNHVPYRGAGPALADLIGGHVDMMFATSAAVASFIEAGTLRPLGITAPAGQSPMKGVPSIADGGLPGYVLDSWYGLYAPAGTPAPVLARLNAALKQAVKTPEFAKMAKTEGLVVRAGTPQELTEFVDVDMARWARIVQENKITAE
jgi:tripartite-type tricarboxylate transporter receptor subunit TctC